MSYYCLTGDPGKTIIQKGRDLDAEIRPSSQPDFQLTLRSLIPARVEFPAVTGHEPITP